MDFPTVTWQIHIYPFGEDMYMFKKNVFRLKKYAILAADAL